MKKGYIISFILGAIVFGTIEVFATNAILANSIAYKNTTVKDAIDDLYNNVKPNYNGDTIFTPTSNSQTINTNGKVLNSNITINPIPSTYKDVTTTTLSSTNDIVSGKTAYLNDGSKVTGTFIPSLFSFYNGSAISPTAWKTQYTLEVGKYYLFATYNGTASNVTVTGATKLDYNQSIWSYLEDNTRKYVYLGIIVPTSTTVTFSKEVNIALLGNY